MITFKARRWLLLATALTVFGTWLWHALTKPHGWKKSFFDAPGLLPEAGNSADSPEAQALLFRGPVVQRVTSSGVTILGKPAQNLLSEEVSVTVSAAGNGTPVIGKGHFDQKRDSFVIRVEGLSPNTVCSYSVQIGSKSIGPFHFMSAPIEGDPNVSFRFAVYGDARTNTSVHRSVANAVLKSRPRFCLLTGDQVEDGNDGPSWDLECFGPARNLAAYVPLFPCFGDHDESDSDAMKRLFDLPGNGRYWAMDYGNIHLITLNIYEERNASSEQYHWLEEELRKKQNGWVICQFHVPPFRAREGHVDKADIIATWVPLFEKYKVDLVFCGHDHMYARSKPIAASPNERGVVYVTSGGGAAHLYRTKPHPYFDFVQSVHHALIVDVSPTRLSGRAFTADGVVFDSFAVEKSGIAANTVVRANEADSAAIKNADEHEEIKK